MGRVALALLALVRRSKWTVLVSLATYCLLSTLYTETLIAHEPGSDGFYTWLYTRSLVHDHDIDFTNDYALCGDKYGHNVDRGTGHPDNAFYIGPSVIWAPILWTLEHLEPAAPTDPPEVKNACTGPLVMKTLGVAPWLAALSVFVMARLARRFVGDGCAALTAGLLGLCTSLPAYAAIMVGYAHVHDTFWAAMMMLASVRAAERPLSVPRWALVGLTAGILMLQRPPSVLLAIVPVTLACATLLRARSPKIGRLAVVLVVMGVGMFFFGALPQMLVYRYLYGAAVGGFRHGSYYMQYGHAHPWLVLFSPHGGLFFNAPVAWLGVAGLVVGLRQRNARVITAATLVACAAAVWLSSAALDWHSSGTFGARRLTALLPLFAIPTAIALAAAMRWLKTKPNRVYTMLALCVLVPSAFTVLGEAKGVGLGRVTTERGMTQGELYGVGAQIAWETMDEKVGDLAILPAEIVFAERYGVSRHTFRDATEPMYIRNHDTLAWAVTSIDLRAHMRKGLVTGVEQQDGGLRIVSHNASIVFAAQWPFATRFVLRAHSGVATRLRFGFGKLFGVRWFGDAALEGAQTAVDIPPGEFDSGIVELVIDCQDLSANVMLESLKIDDTTVYAPAR